MVKTVGYPCTLNLTIRFTAKYLFILQKISLKTTTKLLITILVFCVISTGVAYAQTPQLQWVRQIGNGNGENVTSMITDSLGNIYTTGNFYGTVDFDPGPGVFTLTASQRNNTFISKIDIQGNFLWAKMCGGNSYFSKPAIATDKYRNIYVSESFFDSTFVDTGAGSMLVKSNGFEGSRSSYIMKFTENGNFVWIKIIGSQTLSSVVITSIAVDDYENVYVTGGFYGTIDFDPDSKVYNLTSNYTDSYILQLNSSGDFRWVKQYKSVDKEAVNGGSYVAVDKLGNIYVSGFFGRSLDLDPGIDTLIIRTQIGEQRSYILKLDSAGNFAWVKSFSVNASLDKGNFIKIDAQGNLNVIGYFNRTTVFDSDTSASELFSSGGGDAFVLKFNSDGKLLWAKRMGGAGEDFGTWLTTDHSGNIYTTGLFSGIADFDPGSDIKVMTSSLDNNVFITKLDSNGNYIWSKQLGSSVFVTIDVNPSGEIYVVGSNKGVGDFDPGPNILYLSSFGETDIFIEKLKEMPLALSEPSMPVTFSLYPNPSTNSLTINFGKQITNGRIKLINLMGQTILEKTDINGTSLSVDISSQPKGMYFVEVCNGTTTERLKLLKE